MRIKATYQDGTVIAQAEYGSVDIGEEVAKKGFAEKCKLTSSTNISEEKKSDLGQLVLRNLKSPIPLWGHRSIFNLALAIKYHRFEISGVIN